MRFAAIAFTTMLGLAAPAYAAVNVSIGINLPSYPQLVRVPGYPVYYAPSLNSNYFFYDGLYWVFDGDAWFSSPWYNGPWHTVDPLGVPLYVLRVPVRYYRHPPVYFRGWRADTAPRWDDRWGRSWSQQRSGWDRWDRRSAPAAAPLPTYQRQYSGSRYPSQVEQQSTIHTQNYRYQPRDAAVQQQYSQQVRPQAAAPVQQGDRPRQQGGTAMPQAARPQQQVVTPAPQAAPAPRVEGERRGPKSVDEARNDDDNRGRGKGEDRGQHKGEERGRGNRDR